MLCTQNIKKNLIGVMKYRAIIIFLLISFLFGGCNFSSCESDKDSAFLCMPIDSFLRSYIAIYPQDTIFRLCFFHLGDTEYVQICRLEEYGSNDSAFVDYYSYLDNKLIICFSLDTCSRDSLLNKEKMTRFNGKIDGIEPNPIGGGSDDYDNHPVYLKIISKDSILVTQDMPRKKKRVDKTHDYVVRSSDISAKLDDYMERYDGFHYFLRFATYKDEDYVAIGRSDVYAEKDIIGHFWRNGNMVIIYDSGKEDLRRYINLDSIVPYTDHSINARKGKPEFYFRPDICKYKIDSMGKVMKVDSNSPIYLYI